MNDIELLFGDKADKININDYKFNESGDTLLKYNGKEMYPVIPNIKHIGNSCFLNNEYIAAAVIPICVETIGAEAFKGCHKLMSVNIADTVVSIGNNCFENCVKLKKLRLSNSIKIIPEYCFYNCNIARVILRSSIEEIREYAFVNCNGIAVKFDRYSIKIANTAFFGCMDMHASVFKGSDAEKYCTDHFIPYITTRRRKDERTEL